MLIRIKHDISQLLFHSGDIDNTKKRTSAKLIEKIASIEDDIKQTYNINSEKISLDLTYNDRKITFVEAAPVIANTQKLATPLVVENLVENYDDKLESTLSELKLLAYIYMTQYNLDSIELLVILSDEKGIQYEESAHSLSITEITEFFNSTIDTYLRWIELTKHWRLDRNTSIKTLQFPFKEYRGGQEKLARGVYSTISQNKMLFAQAPTGIGKTMSTLFPSIKAIGEEKIEKIFYLTAKTIGAKVAEDSFDKMRQQGLKFRNVSITAKDKICCNPTGQCNPQSCEYACNYYGKLTHVLYEMLENEETFTREVIEQYAHKYTVCPFELSLDISLYADAIICDYNYVFDPNVYLKRYFEADKCDAVILIDEAHNLVDRSRSMYSAEMTKKLIDNALLFSKDNLPDVEEILLKILIIIDNYEEQSKNSPNNAYTSKVFPGELHKAISKLCESLFVLFRYHNKNGEYNKLLDIYSAANQFLTISELFDEHYIFYIDFNDSVLLKLFCIDPSYNLSQRYNKVKSTIIFSATLSPYQYFKETLGGRDDSYALCLNSPFDVKNREIFMIDNVSTRYKDREKSYDIITDYIGGIVNEKTGNYMVFLPSFDYLKKVKEKFNRKYPIINTIQQDTMMSEAERELYLDNFKENPVDTLVSFNVISGIFSEGIDLTDDKLIGSIIVGVGLPMICLERDLIKDFFQAKNGNGFDFAYTYPGISKVIQSAGRVIRTDSDKGIIALIDDRFGTNKYKAILPQEWNNYKTICTIEEAKFATAYFWNQQE